MGTERASPRNPESPKQDKFPPNQSKEEDIGSLPEKEFRIMIVKMIQNLENGVTDTSTREQGLRRHKKCLIRT